MFFQEKTPHKIFYERSGAWWNFLNDAGAALAVSYAMFVPHKEASHAEVSILRSHDGRYGPVPKYINSNAG